MVSFVADDEDAILEVLEFTLTRLLTGKGERVKNAHVEEELNVVERRASRMSHDGVARDIENCCNCVIHEMCFDRERLNNIIALSARQSNDIIALAKRIAVLSASYACCFLLASSLATLTTPMMVGGKDSAGYVIVVIFILGHILTNFITVQKLAITCDRFITSLAIVLVAQRFDVLRI